MTGKARGKEDKVYLQEHPSRRHKNKCYLCPVAVAPHRARLPLAFLHLLRSRLWIARLSRSVLVLTDDTPSLPTPTARHGTLQQSDN